MMSFRASAFCEARNLLFCLVIPSERFLRSEEPAFALSFRASAVCEARNLGEPREASRTRRRMIARLARFLAMTHNPQASQEESAFHRCHRCVIPKTRAFSSESRDLARSAPPLPTSPPNSLCHSDARAPASQEDPAFLPCHSERALFAKRGIWASRAKRRALGDA